MQPQALLWPLSLTTRTHTLEIRHAPLFPLTALCSAYASPLFLERAFEHVIAMANHLRGRGDQLAIYATVTPGSNARLCDYEVCPLSAPDFTAIRRELNSILCSDLAAHQFPQIGGAITQAADALRGLDFAKDADIRSARRAVIAIVPHSVDFKDQIPEIGNVQLHFLSSGVLPSHAIPSDSYGWFVNTPGSQRFPTAEDGSEEEGQTRTLTLLLTSARYGAQLGAMQNILIDIQAGPESRILETIGNQSPERLFPGQAISLLVKVKVDSMEQLGDEGDGKYTASRDGFTISRAFNELEKILNELLRELITVRVSYRHSHFPANTTLEMTEVAWIRRPAHHSRASDASSKSQDSTAQKLAAHKAVALAAAGAFNARDASTRLERIARHLIHLDPRSLDLMREELDFQMHVDGESYLVDKFERQHLSGYTPRLKHRPSQLEISSARMREEAMRSLTGASRASSDVRRGHRDVVRSPTPSQRSAVHAPPAPPGTTPLSSPSPGFQAPPVRGLSADGPETGDPARRVWRQMRNLSRGREAEAPLEEEEEEREGEDRFDEGEQPLDDKVMMVRHEALRNRRSIGNDTLRSMARSMKRRENSCGSSGRR
jgi:hypothetical protein